MDEERIRAAEERLARARAREHRSAADPYRDHDEWSAAIDEALRAAVLFYLGTNDSGWDGSYVTVVNQSSDAEEPLGVIESERRNSVHPLHRGGWHESMKHYVLCFHDETLECLASGIRTSRILAGFGDAVSSLSARLLG